MCVTALLLGHRTSGAFDRAFAAVTAALCMLPCRTILPHLFRSANGPPEEGARRKARAGPTTKGRSGSVQPEPVRAAGSAAPFVRGGTTVLKSSELPFLHIHGDSTH